MQGSPESSTKSVTRASASIGCLIFVVLLSSFCFAVNMPDSAAAVITSSEKLKLLSRINECERNNRLAEADSLFAVLDRYKALSLSDLLRWAHAMVVLNRYTGSAVLYSRVISAESQLVHVVYGQFNQLFENAGADSIAAALGVFQKTVFSRRGIDTLGIQLWLADFYARHGLDSAELEVLRAVPATAPRLVPQLIDMARQRFGRGAYAAAILPASAAYEHTASVPYRSGAAVVLYQSYQALHKNDSALVWLERAGGSLSESRRADAAALYQAAGRLSDAKAMIKEIPPSFSRDTLEVRQCLWSGDTRKAAEMAKKGGSTWAQHPNEALLWRTRTLLWSGAYDDLAALLDTARIAASWKGAKEILDCRFRFQLFKRSNEALAAWSHIEYDVFTGNPERAAQRLAGSGVQTVPQALRAPLLLCVIRGYFRGNYAQVSSPIPALTAFLEEHGENVDSPEYLYYFAEALLMNGSFDRAEKLLLRIIGDYPGDVFSEKARVVLAKLQHRN